MNDDLAWALAFLPLGSALLHVVAVVNGINPDVVSGLTLAASAALVVMDKRRLAGLGRLDPARAPSTAWLLFPPGYLRRRSRLLGDGRARSRIALACMALAFAVQADVTMAVLHGGPEAATQSVQPPVMRSESPGPTTIPAAPGPAGAPEDAAASSARLPACAEDAVTQDVIDVFGKLEPMRRSATEGFLLIKRTEVPGGELLTPPVRLCVGTMKASDGQDYNIEYAFETVEGHMVVHVGLK